MSLSNGRGYLAIPGPSVMPDEVLQAMHRPAPNIYGGELVDMTGTVLRDLKRVACTDAHVAIYICNGHGTWDAALANVIAPGDRVLVPATGTFGHEWAGVAEAIGARVDVLDFGRQSPVDLSRVEDALRADTSHEIKAVMATHVDTSTSIRNDIQGLRAAMEAAGHPALLMVDCIASLACDRFEMDAWGADIVVAASQKGLMTPPGLGFVWFSEKAKEARARMQRVSRYWDWSLRIEPEIFYHYFGGTAPTHHMFGLRKALDMILDEGMERVWARHEHLARAIWAACDRWSEGGPLRMNVADADYRSRAVTSLSLTSPQGTRLRHWAERKAGVTLGIGLGMAGRDDPAANGYFRIGHMGHVNAHMVLGMLGTIEAGLQALDIPHGAGALAAAAKIVAEA